MLQNKLKWYLKDFATLHTETHMMPKQKAEYLYEVMRPMIVTVFNGNHNTKLKKTNTIYRQIVFLFFKYAMEELLAGNKVRLSIYGDIYLKVKAKLSYRNLKYVYDPITKGIKWNLFIKLPKRIRKEIEDGYYFANFDGITEELFQRNILKGKFYK